MSFGSVLKKIGKIALPIASAAAIPFTGGTSALGMLGLGSKAVQGIGAGASALSSVLGGAAKGSQDQNNLDRNAQMAAEQTKLQAPGIRANTALKAALAKNFTPQTVQWGGPGSGLRGEMPTFSGGLSASMQESQRDPMLQQMLQDAMAGKAPVSIDAAAANKTSGLDKALGSGSLISGILGAIMKARQQPTAPTAGV